MPRPATTRLQRQLQGAVKPVRTTPLDALKLARRKFLKGQPIDLKELARELGVNRVTLYRWVGTYEMLLGEVLCTLADQAWRAACESARKSDPDYVTKVLHRFLELIQAHEPFQRFVRTEGEFALKVATSKHSRLQARVIEHCRLLLEEQLEAGRLDLPGDLESLAYALIRISESFLYNDLITGHAPDLSKASRIMKALLHAPWSSLE
jgi:AcrR family transcriptional regulator